MVNFTMFCVFCGWQSPYLIVDREPQGTAATSFAMTAQKQLPTVYCHSTCQDVFLLKALLSLSNRILHKHHDDLIFCGNFKNLIS